MTKQIMKLQGCIH